jgi:release factor glutamine methyltransferase
MNPSHIKNWKDLVPKYPEGNFLYKKIIQFFDFFNYNKDFNNVYEPAEDSFLLIDTILAEVDFLRNKDIKTSIEIGCGSGLVSLSFLEIITEGKKLNNIPEHFCLDINIDCINLVENLFKNFDYHHNTNFIESNLFEIFKDKEKFPKGKIFDFIFFNPVRIIIKYNEIKE